MSVQEARLKAIADAIREKEGSTAPIPAGEFASRILALADKGLHLPLTVNTDEGASVIARNGDVTLEGIAGSGQVVLHLNKSGVWSVEAVKDGGVIASGNVEVPSGYEIALKKKTLPDGYTELAYVYNEQTYNPVVYMSLGVNPSAYMRFCLDAEINIGNISNTRYIFAQGTSTKTHNSLSFTSSRFFAEFLGGNAVIPVQEEFNNKRIVIDIDLPNKKLKIGGETADFTDFTSSTTGSLSLWCYSGIFNSAMAAAMKVYSLKIYLNDELIRDLVPCIQVSTNKNGFYDLVSNSFFTVATNYSNYLLAGPAV